MCKPFRNNAPISTEDAVQENGQDAQPNSTPQNLTTEPPPPKKPTATAYLERIPIAGLHNLLYAEEKWEWYLWLVTLFLASIVTIRYIVPAFTQYLEFDTALEIRHVSDPNVPFPNVHVCMSDGVSQIRLLRLIYDLKPRLDNDSRYQLLAERFRPVAWWMNECKRPYCSVPPLINLIILYMITPPNVKIDWLDRDHLVALNEMVAELIEMLGPDWRGLNNMYKETMYECEDVLARCVFNDIEFPCCHGDTLMAARAVFYKLNVGPAFV